MKKKLILPILVFFTTILCFLGISRNSLTLDEVNTIVISRNFTSMLSIFWWDEANMWFYHFLMNIWLKLGDSALILRGLSAFFAILTIPIFYKLCKEIIDKTTSGIATFLMSINLYFLFYAQTARSYSLGLLAVTLMSYYFIKFVKNTSSIRNLILYCIFATVAIYTYLLTGLVIAAQITSLIFFHKKIPWKKIIAACFIIGLSIIPLIVSPAFHGEQMDWLQKPGLTYLAMAFIMLGGDSIIVTLLTFYIVGYLLLINKESLVKSSWKSFVLSFLFLWAFFPILSGFLFSIFVKPIFEPESFNSSLPAFIILVGLGLKTIKNKQKTYSALLILITLFSLIRLIAWYGEYNRPHIVIENTSPRDWKNVAKYIDVMSRENDAVIFYSYYINNPFQYYFERNPKLYHAKIIEIASADYPINGGTVLPEADYNLLDSMEKKYNRVWLVLSYHNFSWLDRKQQEFKIEKELEKFYSLGLDRQFNQIEIKQYVRKSI